METPQNHGLLDGLRSLATAAFPKRCASCGREFHDVAQFINETEQVRPGVSGLKQGYDDDDAAIIEVFRNCPCGSTLMDFFSNRRDDSDNGNIRREKFAALLALVVSKGVETELARAELRKVLRGEPSELVAGLLRTSI